MSSKLFISLASLLVIGGGVWYFTSSHGSSKNSYIYVEVKRGDLHSVVSSTGDIEAVGTVQVGTQISGTIAKLYADFNQRVKKGQLLAELQTDLLEASVRDARASVDKAKAAFALARDEYDRDKPLADKGYLSAREFSTVRSNLDQASSGVTSAQATLSKALTNLSYARIVSPIDGTVIARNVDVGQTVAASLSTPTLFVIARDLAQLEIHANVDESDIGQIQIGQSVHFTVQAYPDKSFDGVVTQIRVQPTTVQNVVNYTVVVSAGNPNNVLLPGMTATVEFDVKDANNVLMVPNAALRFQPTPDMLAQYQKQKGSSNLDSGALRSGRGGQRRGGADSSARRGSRGGAGGAGGRARLWTFDSTTGMLGVIPVRTGLSDGQNTEINSPNVHEGMKVIAGVNSPATDKTKTTSSSPLVPTAPGGGGRRGGF